MQRCWRLLCMTDGRIMDLRANFHHQRQWVDRRAAAHSSSSDATTSMMETPPLLLEGDKMYISQSGKSQTVYRLKEGSASSNYKDFILEESYAIERARKKMSLLLASLKSSSTFSFDLQEINHGVQNGSGTGSQSWDSSVVMGLYFGMQPEELRGHVLELGSGVGLGGILSLSSYIMANNVNHGGTAAAAAASKKSITLTDVNEDILNMLQRNIANASNASSCSFVKDNICIDKLDWFDFLGGDMHAPEDRRYDTIIASDCAYLRSQIEPLIGTISALLGNKRNEKFHMFTPYNRSVVHELIGALRQKGDMCVKVDDIELSKYRIKQDVDGCVPKPAAIRGILDDDNVPCESKFLHVSAWRKGLGVNDRRRGSDID